MSHEEDKFKHSIRRMRTENIIKKQLKIAKEHLVEITEPHRLAKHHALDCGISECPICSSPRKRGERTIQEKRFYQDKLEKDSA